jgi:hypothetical protein
LTHSVGGYNKGRVIFVGRDFRTTAAVKGQVTLTLQPVISYNACDIHIPRIYISNRREFILLQEEIKATLSMTLRRLEVVMDLTYNSNDLGYDEGIEHEYSSYFIKQIANIETAICKSILYTYPTRGDLEVEYYRRENIEAFAAKSTKLSLPLVLFIDDFGIHRNMYRALKGFYLTPACLSYTERQKT